MKVNWKQKFKPNRNKLLIGGFGLCIAGIALLSIKFSRPTVKDKSQLKFISGQFDSYKFTDGTKGYHNYVFWLKEYSNSFQINADFLSLFYSNDFKMLNYHDSITISIAKEDINKLNKSNLFIFSILSPKSTYLDLANVIKKYNRKTDYYFFVGLFALGLSFIYFGYKSKKE